MHSFKKIVSITLTSIMMLSTTIVANAESSQEIINTSETKLQQNEQVINQKEAEKQTALKELQEIQNELATLEGNLAQNKQQLATIEQNINTTKQLIQTKKEEIVVLEDKVLARKGIMKERLVSLQHTDQMNLIIETLLNSENFSDFVERATAVSIFLTVDKDILEQQQQDLKKIEDEKAEIDKQEKVLAEQYQSLAANQAALEENLKKRQEVLTAAQEKYNTITTELQLAEQEKTAIQEQLNQAQASLHKQQQEAAARNTQVTQANEQAQTNQVSGVANTGGKELYVTATAYSHEETSLDITAMGHNIKDNPNMKLIAVDPSVIPLGSRVWVEGYGEAIAGDTGGAIKGHKIDVLMPSGAAARSWGRKTVKIVILN